MARAVDTTVLIVSALAVFFATLFGALVLLQPDTAEPGDTGFAEPLPEVSAAPSVRESPAATVRRLDETQPIDAGPSNVERALEELGVRCALEDCFPD